MQPLGAFDTAMVRQVVKGINACYNVDISITPERSVPDSAYYAPNKRFRAEIILRILDAQADTKYTKLVGLTNADISTTKGQHYDWGVFGLGMYNGRVCVISTFRLRKGKPSRSRLVGRLVKVVNHELGHTFGLWHCPNRGCLMEDAQGTIKTVDRETGTFCVDCRARLADIVK